MSNSLLWDRVAHFLASLHNEPQPVVRATRAPVPDPAQARLASRITQTEHALDMTREQLDDERQRSRKWERRAVVANADLAAARGTASGEVDGLRARLRDVEKENRELDTRVTRLARMLAVAEEQRGVALARLAGFAGGIEGFQEENRLLAGTVHTLELELDNVCGEWLSEVDELESTIRNLEQREADLLDRIAGVETDLDDAAIEMLVAQEKVSHLEAGLTDAEADRCLVSVISAEKERLVDRLEQLTQTADKVPRLESDHARLVAEADEKDRRIETANKLLLGLKDEHERLLLDVEEKEQNAQSMEQMFADMKKECERLREERNEKARQCDSIAEMHKELHLKQETATQSLRKTLDSKNIEAENYKTTVARLEADCGDKSDRINALVKAHRELAAMLQHADALIDETSGVVDLTPAVQFLLDGRASLEADMRALRRQLEVTLKQSSVTSEEAEMLKETVKRHEIANDFISARNSFFENEVTRLTRENQDRMTVSEKLHLENQRAAEKLVRLDAEALRAKEEMMRLKEETETLKQQNAEIHEKSVGLEHTADKLREENEARKKELQTLLDDKSTLQSSIEQVKSTSENLLTERDSLDAEIRKLHESFASERETLVGQLAERTAGFASVETELKDARETYVIAAKKFEAQRLSLTCRLSVSERRKLEAEQGLAEAASLADSSATQLDQFMERCQKLEVENDSLKAAMRSSGRLQLDDGDVIVLREMLSESEAERERLAQEVEGLQRVCTERRLSSSSISSDEDMLRRVHELELSLEEEARRKQEQARQLNEAERNEALLRRQVTDLQAAMREKERAAERLKGEMAAIHSRMRRMAHVSLPRGAEELLREDEDMRRLAEVREQTRRQEEGERAREEKIREKRREERISGGKKVVGQRRRVKLGALENKTRMRS